IPTTQMPRLDRGAAGQLGIDSSQERLIDRLVLVLDDELGCSLEVVEQVEVVHRADSSCVTRTQKTLGVQSASGQTVEHLARGVVDASQINHGDTRHGGVLSR